MAWSRVWLLLGALLCLWVLAANVSTDFHRVRIRLVTTPSAAQQTISLPLARAAEIPEPDLVLVYRVRNAGTEPVRISARLDNEVLDVRLVTPGTSTRVDLVWPRPASVHPGYRIDLAGTTSQWTLDYAELANVHGFTRGYVEFLILPAAQPFTSATPWMLVALATWALLVSTRRPAPWPRALRLAHLASSIASVGFFLTAAASPLVSSFRVVLVPHTFILGCLVLCAPHVLQLLHECGRWATRTAAHIVELAPSPAFVRHVVGLVPWFGLMIATAGAAYALVLSLHVGGDAGGADQSGYLNSARLIAEGHIRTRMRTVPTFPPDVVPRSTYMPLGFRIGDDNTLVPSYPVGLPLMVAAIAHLTGWESAPEWTMVLHALLGLALIFWLARECGLSSRTSAIAALILATSPVYLYMSLTLMSDTPALVWTTAAILLAWRSRQDHRWAVLAGAALSLAVATRPTSVLALAPIAVCFGVSPRRWVWLGAGAAPGAALLLRYNIVAYGKAFTTGYGDTSTLFALDNVGLSLWSYAQWLPVLLTPIGLLALGLPAIVGRAPRLVTMLLLWIGVFLVFYVFYYHTHETWWYLRFLLPAFPPLIVGSLLVGRALLEHWNSRRGLPAFFRSAPAALLLAAFILWHNVRWGDWFNVLGVGSGAGAYRDIAEWTTVHLPPDAAIMAMEASGSFRYYTNFPIVRWDFLERDPDAVQRMEHEAAEGRLKVYAVLFPYEIDSLRFFKRIPGPWIRVGAVHNITVWRLTEGRGVNSELP